MERKGEAWRELWWGNRVYTIDLLGSAAILGFVYQLDGNEKYGELARRLLMAAANWDPKGSTGYRYNDEAGMPYAYYFARTYTFVHDLLSEEEKRLCRTVMKVRGEEMYQHLCPRHLWRPFSSHSNRAWHFLGEVAIAFHGEIEGADDWLWFAMNVFGNAYPVWSDSDGGWHEGVSYWRSYIARFTWWADIMREAVNIDAFRLPYFSKAGYWPMYLQPPGTKAGGFGDLAFTKDSTFSLSLMYHLSRQAGNPHWRWYVETQGYTPQETTYVDFLRHALPEVEAREPTELPSSKLFAGIGQAVLNSNLQDGTRNVSVIFKASPFGTQSHGYEAQNAFQVYAFGQPLLIRTGRRDVHGSMHHQKWMWATKSDNSILVDYEGQIEHSAGALAKITRFHTSKLIDYVEGDASQAYGDRLERFTRRILFIKPPLIIVFDSLRAPQPSTFQWLMHTSNEMELRGRRSIWVQNEGAACRVDLLYPPDVKLNQSDQFEPPPRPRIQLHQFHLTANSDKRVLNQHFVTTIQPFRAGSAQPALVELSEVSGGLILTAPTTDGRVEILLKTVEGATLTTGDTESTADLAALYLNEEGQVVDHYSTEEKTPPHLNQ
jgi:hypothetical protein